MVWHAIVLKLQLIYDVLHDIHASRLLIIISVGDLYHPMADGYAAPLWLSLVYQMYTKTA